jgi:methylmalonyl-CoA mutase
MLTRYASKIRALRCPINTRSLAAYPADWTKLATKEIGGGKGPESLEWKTPEGIIIKPLYTGKTNPCFVLIFCWIDIIDHRNNVHIILFQMTADDLPGGKVPDDSPPGSYPYKRGPYATMYTAKP